MMDILRLQRSGAPRRLLAVWVGTAAIAAASGQPAQKVPEPEPTVVTVSARAVPLTEVSASVTLVTRDEIEASQHTTVFDLFQHTPFLHVSQAGARGGLATLSIRGGDPNFTLIMLDGIPVNDPTNILGGSFDLATLRLDNVEQIEIVRGPLSSRHGSEAIGGVINIVSRKGEGAPEALLHIQGGNFGTWEVGGQTSGSVGSWHYAAAASHLDVGEQVENDDFHATQFSLNSGIAPTETTSFDVQFRFGDRTTLGFPPNGGGPEFSLLRDPKSSDVQEAVLGLGWQHQVLPTWFYQLRFDHYDRTEDSQTPAILDAFPPSFASQPPLDTNSDFERTRVTLSNVWDLGLGFQAGADLSFKHESGDVDTLIAQQFPAPFQLERDTWAGGGELRFARGRYQFDAGFRVDDSDDASSEVSPRLGGSVQVGDHETRLKASWGEGFKLPSFFALGEPNVGNANLRPEKSRGFDVGIEQPLGRRRGLVSLTFFRNTFRDLIDFSPEIFQLVNRSEVKTHGVEIGATGSVVESLQISGHVSYVDSEIVGTTEPLRDRPRWRGGVHLDWRPHHRFGVNLRNTWVGPRYDFQIPVPERNQVGGYSAASLGATFRANQDVSLFCRIDNLLDRRFHQFVGFPDAGVYARFGLRYRLRFR